MSLAQVSDVEVRWGRPADPSEAALIAQRLNDVERIIRRRIPDLDGRIGAGLIHPDDLKMVEADAVLRLVRNPEGFIQETDGNYTYMLSREAARGRLYLDDDDWELLGYRRKGMFFIVPDIELPT